MGALVYRLPNWLSFLLLLCCGHKSWLNNLIVVLHVSFPQHPLCRFLPGFRAGHSGLEIRVRNIPSRSPRRKPYFRLSNYGNCCDHLFVHSVEMVPRFKPDGVCFGGHPDTMAAGDYNLPAAVMVGIFLHTGCSKVTGSIVSFHVHEDRI